MKKFVFAVLSAVMPLLAMAITTDVQMATLQHGNKTTVFYGVNAFVDAYNSAADSADVIILSSGRFNTPGTICKSISVYGAGFENDTITGTKRTEMNGLSLKHADGVDDYGEVVKGGKPVNGSYFEGICFTNTTPFKILDNSGVPVKNITIRKCSFLYILNNDASFIIQTNTENVNVIQCNIQRLELTGNALIKNLNITNCIIHNRMGGDYASSSSTISIRNSILRGLYRNYNYLISNSILYGSIGSGATSKNNIFIGVDNTGTNNSNDVNWTGINEVGVWADTGYYELKYPKKYIGTDGTQVGIYGGEYPWNIIPSTPRLLESDIDTKTSAEGILKVSIKVEAQNKE